MTDEQQPNRPSGRVPLRGALSVVYLTLLCIGVVGEAHLRFSTGDLGWILLLAAATGFWVIWQIPQSEAEPVVRLAAITGMTLCGGALVPIAPVALTYVAVGALAATLNCAPPLALGITAVGPLAVWISAVAQGRDASIALAAVAAAAAGVVVGLSRRQASERVEQRALVALERQRTEVVNERAALLAERNRLAREIHDVLAHTLSAMSVQLEALDTVLADDSSTIDEARAGIDQMRSLVREGLGEARRAVTALRDDAAPLGEQLTRLCDAPNVSFTTTGTARPLPAEVSSALYRVAQESITNVVKHAPGAEAAVWLDFAEAHVSLSIENTQGSGQVSPLSQSGSGRGLDGIRERVLLLGGTVDAGPAGGGWRVRASVPA